MLIRIIIPYKSVGLESDATIYKKVIQEINNKYIVKISKDSEITSLHANDIDIYISNANKNWFKHGKTKLFMVNHELFYQNDKDYDEIKEIDIAMCRTTIGHEWALKIKNKHDFKYNIIETKFTTFFPTKDVTKYWNLLLHSAGEHHWKQTDAIIKTWQNHPELPLLVITCTNQCLRNIEPILKKGGYPKNIHLHKKLMEYDDFVTIKNKAGIHLCPSIIEGYGHYINEARKLKSFVITTNYAPMNELIDSSCGLLINCSSFGTKKNGTTLCIINENQIYEAVNKALNISIDDRKHMVELAYKKFLDDTKKFTNSMKEILESVK